MGRSHLIGIVVMAAVGLTAASAGSAQGYGINRAPAPPRAQPRPSDSEAAYDRADRGWRQERHDCLSGASQSRSAAKSCAYIQRTREPLPSDYLKIPTAK